MRQNRGSPFLNHWRSFGHRLKERGSRFSEEPPLRNLLPFLAQEKFPHGWKLTSLSSRVYKRGVLPLIDTLLEGKVLVRTELACYEARRPLTYSFRIEIQFQTGIRRVIDDATKKPSLCRELAIVALLYNIMQGSSSRFHPKAERVL
ncbi:hypothetical protein VNO77_04362 [Canavalia gladiata]|uniref:Uncharacterized protein n=1 Tax=Canavalia gladiata TaxID=3824 RepID=A0AAN9R7Q0_CANGL